MNRHAPDTRESEKFRDDFRDKAIGTIRKYADLNIIKARVVLDTTGRRRRGFALEDLNTYSVSLEPWYDSPHGEEPGSRKEEMHGHL